jgi:hypothetical protein
VREFQVNRNAYLAEYGRAGGAVINVVTKSGTNEYHGNGFYFYRDKSLNAKDYIDAVNGREKAPYHFDQFGASLGGPIVKDTLFFFANYDGQRNTLPNTVVLTIPAGTPSDPDTLAGIAKLQSQAASWNRNLNQDIFRLKADWEAGSASHLAVRYNRQKFDGIGYENGGIQNSVEHTGDSLIRSDTAANPTTSLTTSVSTSCAASGRGTASWHGLQPEPGRSRPPGRPQVFPWAETRSLRGRRRSTGIRRGRRDSPQRSHVLKAG